MKKTLPFPHAFLITAICFVVAILIQLFILYLLSLPHSKCIEILKTIWVQYLSTVLKIVFALLSIITIYQGYRLGFTDQLTTGDGNWTYRAIYANHGIASLLHLNIVSILMGSSYICIPFILYKWLVKKDCVESLDLALLLLITASLSIYTVIRCDTPTNYYASRYFAPVLIPCTILLTAKLVTKKTEFLIFIGIALLANLPFTIIEQNMIGYGGSKELYQDISNTVGQETIILMDENDTQIHIRVLNELRLLNKNLVFNAKNEDEIRKHYSNKAIYLITSSDSDYECVFRKKYRLYDDIQTISGGYPILQTYTEVTVNIYKIPVENLIYDLGNNESFKFDGFSGSEQTFRRAIESPATLNVCLDGTYDYKMYIYLALPVPLERLPNMNKLHGYVSINDEKKLPFCIIEGRHSEKILTFDIRQEDLHPETSLNTISIYSDLWSPKDYGSQDSRSLGLAIDKIVFEKTKIITR